MLILLFLINITLLIGNKIIRLEETSSTNSYAKELVLSNKQAEGIIVLADYQTSGRGQSNKKWLSEKKANLLMSAITKPVFLAPENQFFLSIFVCIAIVRSIEEICAVRPDIKWPNDIMINGKKVAGVLIENSIGNNRIKNSIIGIGLNVNQKYFDPKLPFATSLSNETGRDYSIDEILNVVTTNLRIYYDHLKNNRFLPLRKMYENFMFGISNSVVLSAKNGESIKVIIIGITDRGELLVEKDGSVHSFNHDQVRIQL